MREFLLVGIGKRLIVNECFIISHRDIWPVDRENEMVYAKLVDAELKSVVIIQSAWRNPNVLLIDI